MIDNSDFENTFIALLSDTAEISKKQMKNDVAETKNFIISTGWRASLYWVFRLEWTGTKLKPPVPRKVVDAYEKHGCLMHKVLRLCQAAHPFRNQEWEYDSWLDWFLKIVAEAIEASKILEEKSKTLKLQEQREYLKSLHDLRNPYNDETEPHLWRLIQIWTTKLAELSELEDKVWMPFKRSFSAWLTERDSSRWGCLFEEKTESQLTLKSTKGQGHRHLNLACTIAIKTL